MITSGLQNDVNIPMTQAEALQILKTGRVVFLTGEPGSGKTYVVNRYLQYLREHQVPVAVTASTGIAATHIGGMTIHSWSGIGIRTQLSNQELSKIKANQRLVKRLQKTQVLIIDEVSMLEAKLIDTVDQVLKAVRVNTLPFGGIQVVFVGDFFQLPPVNRSKEPVAFAFEAEAWQAAKPLICYLTEQHRQQDATFLSLLQSIRSGTPSAQAYTYLRGRQQAITDTDTVTKLYTHNADVDRINHQRLQRLKAKSRTYTMSGQGRKSLIEHLKKGCLSPETLELKQGARVMFTKNSFEEGFVNGTLGEIIGFEEDLPVVRTTTGETIYVTPMEWIVEDNGKTLASISQLPLRLAWAITIHKSQGMTLDEAVMDLSAVFEYGQGYVAISRVRTLEKLWLLGINTRALEVHPQILAADTRFQAFAQAVQQRLAQHSEAQIAQKHRAFILRSGGKLKKVKFQPHKAELSTHDQTLELYRQGKTIQEVAQARGLKPGTIFDHLEKLKQDQRLTAQELMRLVPVALVKHLPAIHQVFGQQEDERLAPVFDHFHGKYSYDELRLARLVR